MHKILKLFVIETVSLFLASKVAQGLSFDSEIQGLLITGAALTAASYLVKPIINLFLLPLTLATLGAFKFIGHAITLFIVDLALPQFSVNHFNFTGFSSTYLDLPQINFSGSILSYIAFSVLIFSIASIIHFLVK